MNDLATLKKFLMENNYALESETPAEGTIFGELSGGKLGKIRAHFRVNDDLCNVALMIGALDAVAEADRYGLLVSLMELNYKHALARVSLFRVPPRGSEQPVLAILVAESSFFWTASKPETFNTRIEALYSLAHNASKLLSVNSALSSINPFYAEMKQTPPAVERIDHSATS